MSRKWTYEIGLGYESILRDGVMVNKEQAVRALKKYESRIAELEHDLTNKEIEYTDLWDDALALQARIAELEAAQRWIPVSEPPKVSGKYLLLNIYDDVYPCDFIAGTEIWVLPDYDTITHWMPLPEPRR